MIDASRLSDQEFIGLMIMLGVIFFVTLCELAAHLLWDLSRNEDDEL